MVTRFRPDEVADTKASLAAVSAPHKRHWAPHSWLSHLTKSAFSSRATPEMPWTSFNKLNVCDHLLSAEDPYPILLAGASAPLQLDWTPGRFASAFKGQRCTQKSYTDNRKSQTTFDNFMLTFDQAETRLESFKIQVFLPVLLGHS